MTEKLHTRAHPSYPSFYSRSGSLHSIMGRSNSDGNWPEFHFKIRPKPKFSNRFSRQQIGPNLCISQLELKKRKKPHLNHRVWAAKTAARRREISNSKQSRSWPEFVVSNGESWRVLIRTSRGVDRDR
ncbi:hypothetical protein L3X38_023143 [Prunus dulcis]|uniref:Uncharacterized protein n=1 Tax=Prunus dulcis TaxID=3755 RepID=A0AAD4VXA1_PRUDU|nr:hypothetical protein L3X38_023143 [Prunus dulcis]